MKQTQAFQFINFNRSRVITALLISLSTALIFGLINPLDLFWCNRAELFVSLTEVLQCLLFPMCMVFFAVLLLLLIAPVSEFLLQAEMTMLNSLEQVLKLTGP